MTPLRMLGVDTYDTPEELAVSDPLGQLALVLDPLTLYVLTASGYQVLGAGEAAPASTPASETGQGVVELANQAEVEGGTEGILVPSANRLKAELDRRGQVAATETALGPVELATEAEVQGGTAGTLVATAARLKAELDRRFAQLAPGAWIAPTLVNSWGNYGTPYEVAGYRKTPLGEVQLRGTIKNGATADGTVLFTLPLGYRPATSRGPFVAATGGSGITRMFVGSGGAVTIESAPGNTQLSLESVRFDVA